MTRSRSPSFFNYTLHGTTLNSTRTQNTSASPSLYYKDLTWGKHVDNNRARANQQLAFVRSTIRTRSSSQKEKLYKTLVRPHIVYAATVWDPPNIYHNTSSVSDMLHTLGWRSLEHRRATSRLYCICCSQSTMVLLVSHMILIIYFILPYRHTPQPSRQTDIHTLAAFKCRTNYFKCFFFHQTIIYCCLECTP